MSEVVLTTKEELAELIAKIINDPIDRLTKEFRKPEIDQLLTREETCNLLQIDQSTLWHWTNKGKVKAYGIGNRRYYKRSEILDSLSLLKK